MLTFLYRLFLVVRFHSPSQAAESPEVGFSSSFQFSPFSLSSHVSSLLASSPLFCSLAQISMVNKVKVFMALCSLFFVVLFVLAALSPETLSFDLGQVSFTTPFHDNDPAVQRNSDNDAEFENAAAHHSNTSSCFTALPASLYPSSDASISLSQCDAWWRGNILFIQFPVLIR